MNNTNHDDDKNNKTNCARGKNQPTGLCAAAALLETKPSRASRDAVSSSVWRRVALDEEIAYGETLPAPSQSTERPASGAIIKLHLREWSAWIWDCSWPQLTERDT